MATRESVEAMIQQCEDAIRFANDQFTNKQYPGAL